MTYVHGGVVCGWQLVVLLLEMVGGLYDWG